MARVDLENGRIAISHGLVLGPDGLVEKDTKVHAVRTVSIDATALSMLAQHRERVFDRAAIGAVALDGGAFVFSDSADQTEPWRPDSTSRRFSQLRERCGLPSVRLHDLRHYVPTTMLTSEIDVRTVAGRLGHRNASTTLNVYSHFLESSDKDAADVLGRIFDEAIAPADEEE